MTTLAEVRKSITKMGWDRVRSGGDESVKHVVTGVLSYDMAMLGGVPTGQINQTIGYGSSGKTTLSFIQIAAFQRAFPDKIVVFVDLEGTVDWTWAACFGVDLSRVEPLRPETGEQAIDLVHAYIQAKDVSLVVFDSIPYLFSEKALEKGADENSTPGQQARLTSNLLSKCVHVISTAKNNGQEAPTLNVINYWRSKIVMMGDPRSMPGGNHLYQATYTLFNLKNEEKKGQDPVTKDVVALFNEHSFEVVKNKRGNSLKQGSFVIRRTDTEGPVGSIRQMETLWTFGRRLGLITGGGSKFKIEPLGLEGKKDAILKQLETTEVLLEPLYHEILCRHRMKYGKGRDNWRAGKFLTVDWPDWNPDASTDTEDE